VAALGALRSVRGTAARGTTDAGPPRRPELSVRGSCWREGGVAAQCGTGKQWRRDAGEGGRCGSGGPILQWRPNPAVASAQADRSDDEHTSEFVGERAHGRIPAASARAAVAAMLSVPGGTPRAGAGSSSCRRGRAAAANCR
jgi:hypothetical protein